MCINRKRQTDAGLLVEDGDDEDGRSQPVPAEKKHHFSCFSLFLRYIYARWSFSILTLFLLAPALRYPSQLVMFLPQLAETLTFPLQTSLQLQDQNLRTHRHTYTCHSPVAFYFPSDTMQNLKSLKDLYFYESQKIAAWKQTGREQTSFSCAAF